MLDAIGAPANAEAWLLGELAAGRRIMGMGHRIYRVRDPRAAVLETAVKPLVDADASSSRARSRPPPRRSCARRKPDRPLAANVEFYTAVLLDAVGLPREQFSPTFAVGRIAGWSRARARAAPRRQADPPGVDVRRADARLVEARRSSSTDASDRAPTKNILREVLPGALTVTVTTSFV